MGYSLALLKPNKSQYSSIADAVRYKILFHFRLKDLLQVISLQFQKLSLIVMNYDEYLFKDDSKVFLQNFSVLSKS